MIHRSALALRLLAVSFLLGSCEPEVEEAAETPAQSELSGCTAPVVVTHQVSDRLMPGEGLMVGQRIERSFAAGYDALDMQNDCNLVVYDTLGGSERAIWASNTQGQGKTCFAIMQSDGNLVVYSQPACWNPVAVWSSRTNGRPNSYVRMQSDGNLVIYNGTKAIWASNTVQKNRTIRTGDEGATPHPGCVFARTNTKCGHLPKIPPGILACQDVYTCGDGRNGSVHPAEVSDSWRACGPCAGGKF